MKKFVAILLSVAMVLCTCACSVQNEQKEKFKKSFLELFDTASTVIAYDDSQEAFDQHFQMFYDELEKYDHLFDIYNHYDGYVNLFDINEKAGKEDVKVDPAIIELLQFGKEAYKISGGKTNICFGAVLRLWHNEREHATANPEDAKIPSMDDLKDASEHTSIDDLIIDEANRTVRFADPNMLLDVGAIAKGFAVQKMVEFSKKNLWNDAAISIGGNIYTIGHKNNDKTLWHIGLESPRDTSDFLLYVDISEKTIVTSGDYQRYFEVDGKRYCHIINPETLMPSEYVASVSVICDDSGMGDALSTSLFNMSIEDGKKLVESLENVEAVWVDKEYNKTYSSHFQDYIAQE